MHSSYEDIRSRISQDPIWFDDHGVPRYERFTPHLLPSIYANEAVLMEIQCQDCPEKFLVGMQCHVFIARQTFSSCMEDYLRHQGQGSVWAPIHYGDPPMHDCSGGAGPTMNCYDLRILEFWIKPNLTRLECDSEWQRVQKYEIEIERPK